MQNLESQKAVVMGGTSGIGLAAAAKLSELGAKVVVTGRDRARGVQVLEFIFPKRAARR